MHIGDVDAPDDADLLLWPQYTDTHGLQKSCGGKGTVCGHSLKRRVLLSTSATPSRGEPADPCLDRFLLIFLAPYIKGPILLCKGLFWVVIFADTGEGVAEYIKGGYLQCKRRSGQIGYAPYLEGLAQILAR